MAKRTYRVTVIVTGQGDDHHIRASYTQKEEAEEALRTISEAQQRGGEALLTLPWLTVAEKNILAAFIEPLWTGTSSAAVRRPPEQ